MSAPISATEQVELNGVWRWTMTGRRISVSLLMLLIATECAWAQGQTPAPNQQLSQADMWSKYPPIPSGQSRSFLYRGNPLAIARYVLFQGEAALRITGYILTLSAVHMVRGYLFITPTRVVLWETGKDQPEIDSQRQDLKKKDKYAQAHAFMAFYTASNPKEGVRIYFGLLDNDDRHAVYPDSPELASFIEGAINDLPGTLIAIGVPVPHPYDGAMQDAAAQANRSALAAESGWGAAPRQAAQETPEEAESDRQSKIQESQSEIESAQRHAQDCDERAADMQRQADWYANQGGVGAISAGIGYAGAAKFRNDAQKARQKIADLTRQIQQLQRESVMAAREQATRQAAADSQEQVARQEAARVAASQNGANGSDSKQAENQQAVREQAEQEESQRQSKFQQLQAEIESKQKLARMYDENAADLQRQQAAEANQRGGAAAAVIAQIGIDTFHRDAQQARQEAGGLQLQLNALGAESRQSNPQNISLSPSSTNSSADSNASAVTQPTSSGGSGTYMGPNADRVHQLLGRVGAWSCPSNPIASDGAPPQVQANGTSMRDQYVKNAVLEAWAAECYARQQRDNTAQEHASAMMKSIQDAQSLCSNASVIAGGPAPATMSIVGCNESQPNSSSSGTSQLTPTAQLTNGCIRITNVVFKSTAEISTLFFDIVNNCQVSVGVAVFFHQYSRDTCLHGQIYTSTPGITVHTGRDTPINQMETKFVALPTDPRQKGPDLTEFLVPTACSNPWLGFN
jgi:hypothetical protein